MWLPEEAEALGFATLAEILSWADVEAPVVEAIEAQTGSFSNSVRKLSLLPHAVIYNAISAARCPGEASSSARPLTPVEAESFGTAWNIACRIAYVKGGGLWRDAKDTKATENPNAGRAPHEEQGRKHEAASDTGAPSTEVKIEDLDPIEDEELSHAAQCEPAACRDLRRVSFKTERVAPVDERKASRPVDEYSSTLSLKTERVEWLQKAAQREAADEQFLEDLQNSFPLNASDTDAFKNVELPVHAHERDDPPVNLPTSVAAASAEDLPPSDLQTLLASLLPAEVNEKLTSFTPAELKAQCKHYNLSTTGAKKDLVSRLKRSLRPDLPMPGRKSAAQRQPKAAVDDDSADEAPSEPSPAAALAPALAPVPRDEEPAPSAPSSAAALSPAPAPGLHEEEPARPSLMRRLFPSPAAAAGHAARDTAADETKGAEDNASAAIRKSAVVAAGLPPVSKNCGKQTLVEAAPVTDFVPSASAHEEPLAEPSPPPEVADHAASPEPRACEEHIMEKIHGTASCPEKVAELAAPAEDASYPEKVAELAASLDEIEECPRIPPANVEELAQGVAAASPGTHGPDVASPINGRPARLDPWTEYLKERTWTLGAAATATVLMGLTTSTLKDHCQRNSLEISGTKTKLIARLSQHLLKMLPTTVNTLDDHAVAVTERSLTSAVPATASRLGDLGAILESLADKDVNTTLMALKVPQLKAHCERYRLSTSGSKRHLVAKLKTRLLPQHSKSHDVNTSRESMGSSCSRASSPEDDDAEIPDAELRRRLSVVTASEAAASEDAADSESDLATPCLVAGVPEAWAAEAVEGREEIACLADPQLELLQAYPGPAADPEVDTAVSVSCDKMPAAFPVESAADDASRACSGNVQEGCSESANIDEAASSMLGVQILSAQADTEDCSRRRLSSDVLNLGADSQAKKIRISLGDIEQEPQPVEAMAQDLAPAAVGEVQGRTPQEYRQAIGGQATWEEASHAAPVADEGSTLHDYEQALVAALAGDMTEDEEQEEEHQKEKEASISGADREDMLAKSERAPAGATGGAESPCKHDAACHRLSTQGFNPDETEEILMSMSTAALRDHCLKGGLKTTGQKKKLVVRLHAYLQGREGSPPRSAARRSSVGGASSRASIASTATRCSISSVSGRCSIGCEDAEPDMDGGALVSAAGQDSQAAGLDTSSCNATEGDVSASVSRSEGLEQVIDDEKKQKEEEKEEQGEEQKEEAGEVKEVSSKESRGSGVAAEGASAESCSGQGGHEGNSLPDETISRDMHNLESNSVSVESDTAGHSNKACSSEVEESSQPVSFGSKAVASVMDVGTLVPSAGQGSQASELEIPSCDATGGEVSAGVFCDEGLGKRTDDAKQLKEEHEDSQVPSEDNQGSVAAAKDGCAESCIRRGGLEDSSSGNENHPHESHQTGGKRESLESDNPADAKRARLSWPDSIACQVSGG